MAVTVLSGGDVVLPDRLLSPGTVVVERERIIEISAGPRAAEPGGTYVDCRNHFILPGFIDVHVHGVEGTDSLDGGDCIARIAARLPRYGVTAFCPTTVACSPADLRQVLGAVAEARTSARPASARVLPAHLESNFINPEFRGAQPLDCLRVPAAGRSSDGEFTGAQILAVIAEARPDVGIVTLASELDGALHLIRDLVKYGHRVSLGHSGATYEQGVAGIEAGAHHATHLFNRMPPLSHRAPGLAGAILEHDEVAAEVICDGVHVHPAMVRVVLSAKQPSRVMAITDGTAGSGLPRGAKAQLGGREITVRDAAFLADGTLAGSVLTMDRAFARLVTAMGVGIVDAATICATTPARELKLQGHGVIAPGSIADLVVLDSDLRVVQTWVGGVHAWSNRS